MVQDSTTPQTTGGVKMQSEDAWRTSILGCRRPGMKSIRVHLPKDTWPLQLCTQENFRTLDLKGTIRPSGCIFYRSLKGKNKHTKSRSLVINFKVLGPQEAYLRQWAPLALSQNKANSLLFFCLLSVPNSLVVLLEVQEIKVKSGASICGGETTHSKTSANPLCPWNARRAPNFLNTTCREPRGGEKPGVQEPALLYC